MKKWAGWLKDHCSTLLELNNRRCLIKRYGDFVSCPLIPVIKHSLIFPIIRR
jgi:hypothetical protein